MAWVVDNSGLGKVPSNEAVEKAQNIEKRPNCGGTQMVSQSEIVVLKQNTEVIFSVHCWHYLFLQPQRLSSPAAKSIVAVLAARRSALLAYVNQGKVASINDSAACLYALRCGGLLR